MSVVSDPVADMLTRIRNANKVRHDSLIVPSSKLKLEVTRILKDEGFIRDYKYREDKVLGGLGIAIISTSKGIMTGKEALQRHLGGEVICYIW